MPILDEINFRITQTNDSRVTEDNNTRILEADSSSSNLNSTSSLTASIILNNAAKLNLNGLGSLQVSGVVLPFQSTLYIKSNGVWKTAIPYVRLNNIWVIPTYIAKKISGNWKRAY